MSKVDEYVTYLRNNTNIMDTSINAYRKAVNKLIEDYGSEPSLQQVNEFVSMKNKKRQGFVRYAVIHYLRMLGFPADDEAWVKKNIVKAKTYKPKREFHYLSDSQRLSILKHMDDDAFRAVYWLQYKTAARARDVLTVRKNYVSFNEGERSVKLRVQAKGNKFRTLYLKKENFEPVRRFFEGDKRRAFAFLQDGFEDLDGDSLRVKVDTAYKRYLEFVQKAAVAAGLPKIGTHDLRRSKGQELDDQEVSIRKIQLLYGHSSIATTVRYLRRDDKVVENVMLQHQ